MQQPNFTTPPPHAVATPEGRHRYRIGTTPSAHHGSTPSCFTPHATPPTQHPPHNPRCAPPPSSPSAGPRYPWLHPLLPLLALARVRGWRTVCDGDLKEGDEGSDSATPTPTPAPPRRSLPLRTSDGRAVDRVHRAWSLPTALVREGAAGQFSGASLRGPHLGGLYRIAVVGTRPPNARAKKTRTCRPTTIDPHC